MPLFSSALPSLSNGVSQQTFTQRLSSQGEAQENFLSSLARGLTRRPPTRHISRLTTDDWSDAALHVINRDAGERYLVAIAEGDLRVFDLDGVEKTVAFPDGKAYLAAATPSTAFRAVTVADHTFVLNATVVAAMSSAVTAERPKEALVNVRQGNYGRTYAIRIDGASVASFSTPDGGVASHSTQIDTSYIAQQLESDLIAAAISGLTVTRYENAIHLSMASGDFAIAVEDGFNGDALTVAKDRLQRFTDLPSRGPDGFHVEIVGDETTAFDNYYVAFDKTDDADSAGVWRETVAPSVAYELDAATMPHLLVREADGTFTFKRADWGDRAVGDEVSAPSPSFIGRRLNDIFFFRNRLGLLADETVILSRAGEYFAFWPKTVTAQLDSDPIDVSGAHKQVSILRHATPFNRSLLLFADRTQFVMEGGDLLTPTTASIRAATEFDASLEAGPAASGRSVFFAASKGAWSSVREYQIDAPSGVEDAIDITRHVPELVPSGVVRLSAAPGEDMLVALSAETPDTLYVYSYYWSRDEKLQSSWSIWRFGGGARILAAEFVSQTLVLAVARDDGVDLEMLELGATEGEGGATEIHLDRRLDGDALSLSYDAPSNRTSIALPYADAELAALQNIASDGDTPVWRSLTVERPDATTIRLTGDHTASDLSVGRPYLSRYVFSPFLMREDQGFGPSAVMEGRLQVLYLALFYAESGAFRVAVTPTGRETYSYRFAGRVTGAGANLLGASALETGRFKLPVYARNTEVTVAVEADSPQPARFTSAEWEGRLTLRSQRGL